MYVYGGGGVKNYQHIKTRMLESKVLKTHSSKSHG